MITVDVEGVGVMGPGLVGWASSAPVLRSAAPYAPAVLDIAPSPLLSPRERRRVSAVVRLALAAAADACGDADVDASQLSSVFASSLGDGILLNALLGAIADPEGKVSPTQFHNSVHNAAAGYWTIGTGNHQSCTSVAAGPFTFAMGLLNAVVHVMGEGRTVLLTVFDHPFPEPLNQARPLLAPFAAALVLSQGRSQGAGRGKLSIELANLEAATPPRSSALRDLWLANPAARALPLLEAIAAAQPSSIVVDAGEHQCLRIEYSPR